MMCAREHQEGYVDACVGIFKNCLLQELRNVAEARLHVSALLPCRPVKDPCALYQLLCHTFCDGDRGINNGIETETETKKRTQSRSLSVLSLPYLWIYGCEDMP